MEFTSGSPTEGLSGLCRVGQKYPVLRGYGGKFHEMLTCRVAEAGINAVLLLPIPRRAVTPLPPDVKRVSPELKSHSVSPLSLF